MQKLFLIPKSVKMSGNKNMNINQIVKNFKRARGEYEVLEIDMLMRDVEFGLPNATVMNSEPNSFGGVPELNMVAISLENADEYWCIHVPEQLLDRYFCDELADNTVNWMVDWYNDLVSAYIHNTLNPTNHRIGE